MIGTATGYRWSDIDDLSLDAVAELLMYWREHPPVHVQLGALMRGLSGKKPASTNSPSVHSEFSQDGPGIHEVLGPPVQTFRPPVRLQQPAQTSAPTPTADEP
jgi:hypothetical protein